MALFNVRLSPEDARRAAALRVDGVRLSDVVREAIRLEYARRVEAPQAKHRPSRIIAAILESLPDPDDMPERDFEMADRRAVRRHIAAKLRGRRK